MSLHWGKKLLVYSREKGNEPHPQEVSRAGFLVWENEVLPLGCFREQDLGIGAWRINHLTWQIGELGNGVRVIGRVSSGPQTMLAILCWSYFCFFIHPSTSK